MAAASIVPYISPLGAPNTIPPRTFYFSNKLNGRVSLSSAYLTEQIATVQPNDSVTPVAGDTYGAWKIQQTSPLIAVQTLHNPRTFLYVQTTFDVDQQTLSQTGPVIVGLTNGSTLATGAVFEAAWAVSGSFATSLGGKTRLHGSLININKSSTAAIYETGFDPTAVNTVTLGGEMIDFKAQETTGQFFSVLIPAVIINGTAGTPGTFDLIFNDTNRTSSLIFFSPTKNIHGCRMSWHVGDGTTETHFAENLKTWEFYGDVDFTEQLIAQSHIFDNDIGFEVNSSALDTFSFNLCVWLGTTPYYWNLLGSTSATGLFTNCVIQGAGDVTIIDNRTFDFCTFDNCGELGVANPVMTNTTIKNSAATRALNLITTSSMSGMTFDSNTTAMVFDFPGSSTVAMDNFTFTGNTTDVEYTGAGVLTIQPTNGTSVGTTLASGSGSIVIATAAVTLKIIVKDPDGNLITDSSVNVLVEAAAGGPLSVGTDIIKGFTDINGEIADTRSYSSDQPISGWVRKSSASPFYQQALVGGTISSSTGLIITIQMVSDE